MKTKLNDNKPKKNLWITVGIIKWIEFRDKNAEMYQIKTLWLTIPFYLLSAQYAIESQDIYGNVNHYVLRISKAHGSDGRKPTTTDIKNVPSLHNLVRTDQAYKLFKNSSMESQTAALLFVGIGDERIIPQCYLLVIKGD